MVVVEVMMTMATMKMMFLGPTYTHFTDGRTAPHVA
jgi:hypothetical protein